MLEDLTGKPSSRSQLPLLVFGSRALLLLPGKQPAFASKSAEGVFVGYSRNNNCPIIYKIDTNAFVESIHVTIFNKVTTIFLANPLESQILLTNPDIKPFDVQSPDHPRTRPQQETISLFDENHREPNSYEIHNMNQLVPINHSPADMAITFKYTIFNTQLHTRDQSHADLLQDNLQRTIPAHIKKGSTTVPLPKTMANISLRADSQQWKDAEEAEARQLTLSNSLELIAKSVLPPNATILRVLENFRIKYHPDGTLNKYKFRYVANGSNQPQSSENYAPVPSFQFIRTMFAVHACDTIPWHEGAFDVDSAFLQAARPQDKPVYVQFPRHSPLFREAYVHLLKKSMYGTNAAPRLFYQHISGILTDRMFFERSRIEPCYFVRAPNTPKEVRLVLFVDDGRTRTRNKSVTDEFLQELHTFIKISVQTSQDFVGLSIKTDIFRRSITLSAPHHAKEFASKMGFETCTPVDIPMHPDTRLSSCDLTKVLPAAELKWYQLGCGYAIFLVQILRFDIAYAVSQLCRFMHAPGPQHKEALIQLIRYVSGTSDFSITYSPPKDKTELNKIFAYADASLGGPHTEGRSITGYVSMINNAAFAWTSHVQKTCVATATVESELMATGSVAQDTIYNRLLLELFIFPQEEVTEIATDNQPALEAVTNGKVSTRTRHFITRFHSIRELISHGDIVVKFLDGARMPANGLTKPEPRVQHRKTVALLSGKSMHGAPTARKPQEV